MSPTKRYVVGRLAVEGRRVASLWSTEVGPHETVALGKGDKTRAVFRSFDKDGKPAGVLGNERFESKRGVLIESRGHMGPFGPVGASVARETDDPMLVALIDEAAKRVDDAREALRVAIHDERAILELAIPRMRIARVSAESTKREVDERVAYIEKLEAETRAAKANP